MKSLLGLSLTFCALVHAGCTFYTGCPNPTQQPPPASGGANNNGGGSANNGGGSANNGGTSGGTSMGEEIVIPSKWQDATGSLIGEATDCGNVMYLAARPGSDKMIAGVVKNGLWESSDGETWTKIGEGKGSAELINVPQTLLFDPEDNQVFWESGLYFGGGVYRTDDGGNTFRQLGAMGHNTTVSVDFTDPERKVLLTAGHEQARVLFLSEDGGESWSDIGARIPDGTVYCDFVHVVDADHFLIGCAAGGGGQVGIFSSSDRGASWERVSEAGGFREPLLTSDGTMYWSALTIGEMVKSTDQGQTWTEVGAGPIHARPLELPDGRIAALGDTRLLISDDAGDTWHPVGPTYPAGFSHEFFAYSPEQKSFYVGGGTCNKTLMEDTIQRLVFDYQKF